jgi:hypothetical protein
VTISAARDCTWSARSEVSWIQLPSTSGQGDSTLAATVARNDLPSTRSGGIVVNEQRVGVTQEARGCDFDLKGSSQPMPAVGGRAVLQVSTINGCAWTASSSASWVSIVNTSGNGTGTVTYDVQANTGAAREANITVGGRSFLVSQEAAIAAPCSFTIDRASQDFSSAGGQASVAVTTQPACQWTASGGSEWTTFVTAAGTGSGNAQYTVGPNASVAPRQTTLTIAGRVHTVTQQGVLCTFTLTPQSQVFSAAGGGGVVQVNTLPGCQWTASSNAGWVSVSTPTAVGSGQATYQVQQNTESATRTAIITIGGQAHVVVQNGAAPTCSYALDPAARSFSATAATSSVRVNTQPGCAWAATSSVPWTVLGQSSGTGSADVPYSVAENTATAARFGNISIAGQSHAITQEGATVPPCTYTLSPVERTFDPAGGPGTVRVTTEVGCTWTATSSDTWVVVTTGSGVGSFDIVYQVAPGSSTVDRTATVTVNGQVHTVRQRGPQTP